MDFVDRMNEGRTYKIVLLEESHVCTLHVKSRLLNYLAHAYLSFDSDAILVGNMVSDFVKGKALLDYPPDIQQGLRLHRLIDSFTDAHPVSKEARKFLSPAVGRYSGAFLDIIYDHFLANDPSRFPPGSLKTFTGKVYALLERDSSLLPESFLQTFRYMKSYDWLYGYSLLEGIRRSLEGMVRRAKYLPDEAPVYPLFTRHYEALKECYGVFFPELEAYVRIQVAL
jgi:acyl carrier protein phosphodiesterase